MRINDLEPATLRRLASLHPERGKVLSLYLDLDPSIFGTPEARSSAITSLLDEADRRARADGRDHEEKVALREDVRRARAFFDADFSADAAGSFALFACGLAGLFETLKLPQPVASEVVIDVTPFIEPLARVGVREPLAAALVNRRDARILRGTRDGLEEVAQQHDDVHGWHKQGGWSQLRYQHGIEKEVRDHLDNTAGRLFDAWKRRPFDHLVVGATAELFPAFEERLHPYLRERVVGRLDVDVGHARPDDVLQAAGPVLEAHDRERERAALEHLEAGLGAHGRAVAGLDDVLAAVHERRVEVLLYAHGMSSPGVGCPKCGWLAREGETCPFDETRAEPRADVVDDAIEAVVLQSGEPLPVRHHDDLERHGRIAALLRF